MVARIPPSRLLLGAAALLVLVVVAGELLGLGRRGIGRGQLLLLGLALVLALGSRLVLRTGVRSRPLFRRLGRGYVVALLALVHALLLVLAAELLTRGVVDNARLLPGLQSEARAELPYYTGKPWAATYWRELRQAERTLYAPYRVWRTAPIAGATLNVDDQGLRPGTPAPGPKDLEVFAFGGSAMWGYGAPDDGTLPIYLERELEGLGFASVRVVNRAERGYVSTQSLIALLLLLQRGEVPDAVVFYDGFNDAAAGLLAGRAGAHLDETRVRRLFEHPFLAWLQSTHLARHLAHLGPPAGAPGGIDPMRLGDEILDLYLANVRMVEALGREYGFEPFFFWQPTLATTHKALTVEEQGLSLGTPELVALLRRLDAALLAEAERDPRLSSARGIFDDEPSQIWIDEVHVTPQGNRLVAHEIAKAMAASAPAAWPRRDR